MPILALRNTAFSSTNRIKRRQVQVEGRMPESVRKKTLAGERGPYAIVPTHTDIDGETRPIRLWLTGNARNIYERLTARVIKASKMYLEDQKSFAQACQERERFERTLLRLRKLLPQQTSKAPITSPPPKNRLIQPVLNIPERRTEASALT